MYCDCLMWFVFCVMVVLTCFVMCVCVDSVKCGCVYVLVLLCVGVLVIRVLVFTVFFDCFVYVYYLFCLY